MILKFTGINSITQLLPGKDYLNPEIKLIIDDIVDNESNKIT